MSYNKLTYYINIIKFKDSYKGKSPITDPLSYLSNYKRYQKSIYT